MRYLGALAGSAALGIVLPMSGSGPWLGCGIYAVAFVVAAAASLALPSRIPIPR
ncbi:MAG: hypothetical protein H0W83_14945 [Planctomycetes bacterium]|nr:hypothetical protein [Planctomycetota bacterium]